MKNRGKKWPRWDEYNKAVLVRFGIQPFDDPFVELMKLKQWGKLEQQRP